jgi:hypothetical protein
MWRRGDESEWPSIRSTVLSAACPRPSWGLKYFWQYATPRERQLALWSLGSAA